MYKDIYCENARLLTLVIDHPFFEDYRYTSTYSESEALTSRGIQYDAYATMVFNLLVEVYILASGTKNAMLEILYFPEYAKMHAKWWEINKKIYKPVGNSRFNQIIDEVVASDETFHWMNI